MKTNLWILGHYSSEFSKPLESRLHFISNGDAAVICENLPYPEAIAIVRAHNKALRAFKEDMFLALTQATDA